MQDIGGRLATQSCELRDGEGIPAPATAERRHGDAGRLQLPDNCVVGPQRSDADRLSRTGLPRGNMTQGSRAAVRIEAIDHVENSRRGAHRSCIWRRRACGL